MADELTDMSASGLAALIKARTVSPVEVLEAFLARIDALDPCWLEDQFEPPGLPFHERGPMSEEYIQAIIARWTHIEPEFEGRVAGVRLTISEVPSQVSALGHDHASRRLTAMTQ
jgi:Asp-tRNA(Asn)/Glu-tRNA(Gln) amidotransferase A subunit family amidase